nr:GntR family transcriptional regulator [Albibacillus kandeliae]
MKKAADTDGETRPASPIHEQVYQELRGRILFGELAPGQPVTIQGLVEALGVGMTPVREAIRRLTSDGALVFLGNRRVIVPTLTMDDLEQLVFIRKTIETELTRRATRRITPEVLAELNQIDTELDGAIAKGNVVGYLALNYRFHTRIYEHAKAPIMAEQADRLWLRSGPPLRVVCGRFGTQNLPDRHKDILDALERQDEAAAARAMGQDIDQGMEQIAAALDLDT